MNNKQRITSVRFVRYKAFRDFSLSLSRFNILVGPNNAGKSTILGAFRILAEAMRRAKTRTASVVDGPSGTSRGYEVNLDIVPIATENVFHNYEDEEGAKVVFRVSTGESLVLYFPERGSCNLTCEVEGRPIASPSGFKQHFDLSIGFVPILGPVEHNEPLYQREAARTALLTHRASRNFRNIWFHYPEDFDSFRSMVQRTWPGMDIKRPEVDRSHPKPLLHMFCPEDRLDREIFWSGFGFQVWCQMLTFIVRNQDASLFIIDEPDIYLHSDLQRQLLSVLKALGPDILLATHSTEMISEADPNDILVVTKEARSAKRVGNPSQLQPVFDTLGSNLNPTLTQLARCRKVVYVEGKDFQVISRFASRVGSRVVAMRSDFAVVPTNGFNPVKARLFTEGIEATLSAKMSVAVLFDRDYRSDAEVLEETEALSQFCAYAHIHRKKEVENFLLVPSALQRAIAKRLADQNARCGTSTRFSESVEERLRVITDEVKYDVQAQYQERQKPFAKAADPSQDDTSITSALLASFDRDWGDLCRRLEIVPGKEILSRLNSFLQATYDVTVTPALIIDSMTPQEIPDEMRGIVLDLQAFARGELSS